MNKNSLVQPPTLLLITKLFHNLRELSILFIYISDMHDFNSESMENKQYIKLTGSIVQCTFHQGNRH